MRGLRQLVQVLDPRLGPAAARAEQIPAHDHDAEALRGEEQLDSVLRRRVPKSRHRQRANAAQGHHRRMQQKLGKLWRKAVARRIASKVGDQRSEAATRGRFSAASRAVAPGSGRASPTRGSSARSRRGVCRLRARSARTTSPTIPACRGTRTRRNRPSGFRCPPDKPRPRHGSGRIGPLMKWRVCVEPAVLLPLAEPLLPLHP